MQGERRASRNMFRGTLTALITPFDGSRVDFDALERVVARQLDAGIHGLVPCGTTGEAATLRREEHLQVVERVVKLVGGRVPVLAGAGSNDTRDAIELTKACEGMGADGTLQVTPYYNRPPQEGLVAHFESIADACDKPIILYNVPSRTGCDMLPDTVTTLSKHSKIVGIKEATGDLARASAIRRTCGDAFTLLSGDDFTILPFMSAGGHGVISVVSNVIPKVIVDLVEDTLDSLALHDFQLKLTEVLFAAPNPIPVKAALKIFGICSDQVRSPLVTLTTDSPVYRRLEALAQEIRHDQ